MVSSPNALRWNGRAGHYEVYYLTLTDPRTGLGVWIRYTMVAPMGPNTPIVGCIAGKDFRSTSPLRILGNHSTYTLTSWRFEAVDGPRKLIGEVTASREQLAGVTYHDPDGEPAYCYNTETASLRLHVYERASQVGGWAHRRTLLAPGRAHFEYAQRTPVPGLELLID
jgi:hypothetical protein